MEAFEIQYSGTGLNHSNPPKKKGPWTQGQSKPHPQ